jgi:hypothetical protein
VRRADFSSHHATCCRGEGTFLDLRVDVLERQFARLERGPRKDEIQNILLDAGIARALAEPLIIAFRARIRASLLLEHLVDADRSLSNLVGGPDVSADGSGGLVFEDDDGDVADGDGGIEGAGGIGLTLRQDDVGHGFRRQALGIREMEAGVILPVAGIQLLALEAPGPGRRPVGVDRFELQNTAPFCPPASGNLRRALHLLRSLLPGFLSAAANRFFAAGRNLRPWRRELQQVVASTQQVG